MITAFGGFAASARHGVIATGRSFAAALCACALMTALSLTPLVAGFVIFPPLNRWLDALVAHARRTTPGQPIVAPRAIAASVPRSLRSQVRYLADEVSSAGFWRRIVWTLVDWIVLCVTVLAPLALALYGVFGVLVQPFVWSAIDRAGGGNWYAFVHVDSPAAALWSIPLGVVFVTLGVLGAPAADRAYGRWIRAILSPTRSEQLAERNRDLTASRADVVDDREDGLSRIQRDLHDGAQARLVAMGMSLDQAVRALDADPDRARLLLAEAQQMSTSALAELRDLVHGIHSPVLADRGLGDAIRSLVLDTGFDVDVSVDLPSRPASSVEGAVYYALSELITNATKHSQAANVSVAITYDEGRLIARVYDNGIGGADISAGTGLAGITRRLAAFDGALRVDSPPGGPTNATVAVPCTLS